MTAIWRNDGANWQIMAPAGFPDEAALHTLVEQAPQVLPLAGSPSLVVLGREVLLGNGYADLIAVEPSGRLAVIEVKLSKNAEARRAVVAQVLTYAAYLKGTSATLLEQAILGQHLSKRGYASIADAVSASDQQGSFDAASFAQGLAQSLEEGGFRLIVVLDEAREELIRLTGYLQAVTDRLVIDLITVSAYEVNGSQILVPQRVDAENGPSAPRTSPKLRPDQGRLVEGADDFAATISTASAEKHPTLQALYDWAISLEKEGLVKLSTYHGTAQRWRLLPRLKADNVGLVTIWNDGGGYLQLWHSVFARRAPTSMARIEPLLAPGKLGQGTVASDITPELLAELTTAYREAAGGTLTSSTETQGPG